MKQVLVVDDEADCREFVTAVLDKVGSCRVLPAANGNEAQAQVRAQRPDLIILDVNMPEKDGYDTFCELRRTPTTADIPVIMLSSLSEMGGYLGDNPAPLRPQLFVEKPIDPDILAGMVKRTLSPE